MLAGILSIILLFVVLQMNGRLRRLQRRVDVLEGWSGAEAATVPQAPTPAAELAVVVERVQEQWTSAPPQPEPVEQAVIEPVQVEEPEEVQPEAVEPVEQQPARARVTFEDMFGRKLPIWAGGVTLAIAGFLLVKYSIDVGLLSPAVRVVLGLIFGSALIAAAEAARHFQERVRDPRVAQALAGAGAATLYGSVLVAANVYALIGPGTAFFGLAAVTALALGLALRFGAPSALLALVGGFAAPLFIGSTEPNLPLLLAYLALTVGGLSVIARAQGWAWLGYAALAGGFLWSAVLIARSPASIANSLSLGSYLLLLGVGLPFIALARRSRTRAAIAAGLGSLQLAAMVAQNGFLPLDWALFALISIGLQWLARRDEALRPIRAIALATALLLLAAWPSPPTDHFAIALTAMLVIHGGPALVDLWRTRGGLLEAGQIAAAAIAVWLIPFIQFEGWDGRDVPYALLALGGCTIAGGAAALGWRREERRADFRFPLLVIAAALCAAGADAIAAPAWQFAPLLGLVAAAVLAVALAADDRRVEIAAGIGAAAAVVGLVATPDHATALAHAAGLPDQLAGWRSILAVFAMTGIAAGLAWFASMQAVRIPAQAIAALLLYLAAAQLVPVRFVPVLVAALLTGLVVATHRSPRQLLAAALALASVLVLWAAEPALEWTVQALLSIGGLPLLVTALPPIDDMLLRLAVPALGLGAAAVVVARGEDQRWRLAALAVPGALLLAAGHIAYKHLFGIADTTAFETFGFAERTLWEGLLIAAGMAVTRLRGEQAFARAGLALVGAGLAHFAWYSLLIHNPLWWPQQVGRVPLLNLLAPAYGLPLIALWLVRRSLPKLERPVQIVTMVLVLLLGWSLLRQAFHGSLLVDPGLGATEDAVRSIFLVGAGVCFLLWGIARGGHDWRIASLVLMLAAAAKVFLWDAAGLEGLLRIGAFVALGFSLIGIGWLYARFVNQPKQAEVIAPSGAPIAPAR